MCKWPMPSRAQGVGVVVGLSGFWSCSFDAFSTIGFWDHPKLISQVDSERLDCGKTSALWTIQVHGVERC